MAVWTLSHSTEIIDGDAYPVKAAHLIDNFNGLKGDIDDRLSIITASAQTITGACTWSAAQTFSSTATFNGAVTCASTVAMSGALTQSATATFSNAAGVTTDNVSERTSANGVDVDGVTCKDGTINIAAAGYTPAANGDFGYDSTAHAYEGYVNGSAVTFATGNTGSRVFLDSKTANDTSQFLDFTSSIDSTYDLYIFEMIDIVPASDGVDFYFRCSDDDGSTYEADAADYRYSYELGGSSGSGPQNDTEFMISIPTLGVGSAAGEKLCGTLSFWTPSNSTTNKMIKSEVVYHRSSDGLPMGGKTDGDFNQTDDVTAVRFSTSSGNIESGSIYMYGVKKS